MAAIGMIARVHRAILEKKSKGLLSPWIDGVNQTEWVRGDIPHWCGRLGPMTWDVQSAEWIGILIFLQMQAMTNCVSKKNKNKKNPSYVGVENICSAVVSEPYFLWPKTYTPLKGIVLGKRLLTLIIIYFILIFSKINNEQFSV